MDYTAKCTATKECQYKSASICKDPFVSCKHVKLIHTNADKIRSMTDEELTEFLNRIELGDIDYSVTFCDLCKDGGNTLGLDCDGCLLHWLQLENEEN